MFLPGGKPPAVGSVFRNPDMAKAYAELRRKGVNAVYRGAIGKDIVRESRAPHTAAGVSVMGGQLTGKDLADYEALKKAPVHSTYKGLDVYGMPIPSSGGIAIAEILNLMRDYEQRTGLKTSEVSNTDYLHRFSEASATAFADRNRYVGDVPGVPVRELTSKGFAAERSCLFDPAKAQPRPIPFGSPDGSYTTCAQGATAQGQPREGLSTTHLVTADKWGNVASYTLTIEQTGGSGITVPGWGFLLNNELTDFDFVPLTKGVPDPNLPGPGKRPRSSMSPTVVLKDDRPWLTLGSPGGATIITSVAQTLLGYVDRDLSARGRDRRPAAVLAQRQGRGRRAGAAGLVGRHGADGEGPRARRAHRGAAGDRCGHRDPHLQPARLPGGGRAGAPRWRLSDGRAPLRTTEQHPEGARARMTGDRELAGEPPGQFRVQPPLQRVRAQVLLHHQVRRAAVGQARQPGAAACRAGPPCRPGSAGWTRSRRTARPPARSSGVPACTSASPSVAALCRARSSARSVDVDRPDRGAGGEQCERQRDRPPAAAEVEHGAGGRRSGRVAGAGPRCRRRAGRGRRCPARSARSTSVPGQRARPACGARRRWPARR